MGRSRPASGSSPGIGGDVENLHRVTLEHGAAGLLVPLVSIAAALTLQPVLLSALATWIARDTVCPPERLHGASSTAAA